VEPQAASRSSSERTIERSAGDVVVVGAGVIGMTSAFELASEGLAVTIVDPSPARGALWAAAGMLAPAAEYLYGEEALARANRASEEAWEELAPRLEAASGRSVGLEHSGTLALAATPADAEALDELGAAARALGLSVERLTPSEAREIEPALAPRLASALWMPDDHHLDNRALGEALLEACRRQGVVFVEAAAARIVVEGERAVGVELAGTGERLLAPKVVLAAGAWSASISGLPDEVVPPIRPVKGQILRLRRSGREVAPTHVVRAMVEGARVYLVPRRSGEIVVGATMEEQGFDTRVTAGAVLDLLRHTWRVVPSIAEMELQEAVARLRPGTPDNAPLVGQSTLPGLVIACGHFRHGILLAPLTAAAVAASVMGREPPATMAPFDPARTIKEAAMP